MRLRVELYQERKSTFRECLEPLKGQQHKPFQNVNLRALYRSMIFTHGLFLVVKISLLIRSEMSLLNYGEVNEILPLVHSKCRHDRESFLYVLP